MALGADSLHEALTTLGELLAERGERHELVAIGGGSLLLMGLIRRATNDLDIVAVVSGEEYESAELLPASLASAVAEVGRLLELPERWLNGGPTDLLRFGLPSGFPGRLETRCFGGLTLHLAGRLDQVAFKLYAAVDNGPRSKHFVDLQKLSPTTDELIWAARWTRTHDPSEGYLGQLVQALELLGVENPGDV